MANITAPDAIPDTKHDETPDQSPNEVPRRPWTRAVKPVRSQVLVGVLCALLGFALVVQVRGTGANQFAALRQEDLVRLLEELTVRGNQLDAEVAQLTATRQELATSSDLAQTAREVAEQRAIVEGILSGRLPAQGPGLEIGISDPTLSLTSVAFVNLLEELRNAGVEAVQVGDYRVVTTSAFTDLGREIYLDGNLLPRDLVWLAIGDPATMGRALEIPGGAFPQIRAAGGDVEVIEPELVEITAIADLRPPQFAMPVAE